MTKTTNPKKEREPRLPDSELEAIRILWRLENATARQVWDALREGGSKWSYATVNTLLQRLEAKGLVTVDKTKISFVYSPKISRQKVIQKRVKDIVDKLYDGQGSLFVMHVLQQQKLSPEEIADLQTQINQVTESDE